MSCEVYDMKICTCNVALRDVASIVNPSAFAEVSIFQMAIRQIDRSFARNKHEPTADVNAWANAMLSITGVSQWAKIIGIPPTSERPSASTEAFTFILLSLTLGVHCSMRQRFDDDQFMIHFAHTRVPELLKRADRWSRKPVRPVLLTPDTGCTENRCDSIVSIVTNACLLHNDPSQCSRERERGRDPLGFESRWITQEGDLARLHHSFRQQLWEFRSPIFFCWLFFVVFN